IRVLSLLCRALRVSGRPGHPPRRGRAYPRLGRHDAGAAGALRGRPAHPQHGAESAGTGDGDYLGEGSVGSPVISVRRVLVYRSIGSRWCQAGRHTMDERFSAGCAWIEGEFVPIGEARIPLLDVGFTRWDATYDVVAVWHGRFFRLDDHLDRFERSWTKLRMQPEQSRAE